MNSLQQAFREGFKKEAQMMGPGDDLISEVQGGTGGALTGGSLGYFAGGPVGAAIGATTGGVLGATAGSVFGNDWENVSDEEAIRAATSGGLISPMPSEEN